MKRIAATAVTALMLLTACTASTPEPEDEDVDDGQVTVTIPGEDDTNDSDSEEGPDTDFEPGPGPGDLDDGPDVPSDEEVPEFEDVDNHAVELAGDAEDFPKEHVDDIIQVAGDYWLAETYRTWQNSDPNQWIDAVRPYTTDRYQALLEEQFGDYWGGADWERFYLGKKHTKLQITRVEFVLDESFDATHAHVRVFGDMKEGGVYSDPDMSTPGALSSVAVMKVVLGDDGEWKVDARPDKGIIP